MSASSPRRSLASRLRWRTGAEAQDLADGVRAAAIRILDRWPYRDPVHLLVGSEGSGTTAIADLLFKDIPGVRFLEESNRYAWVWEAYMRIHQGRATIRDYPRLQLFDAIKVPGFAMIIDPFREAFPEARVAYVVRDPRDIVASAFRTWSGRGIDDPAAIPWVREDWLGITESDPVERLCMRWKRYLRSGTNSTGVVFVRYEDFYADKAQTIRELADRLGLPFNEERVAARKDRQMSRVRDYPPHGPSTWRSLLTDEQARTIVTLCGDEMLRWGYRS